VNRVPHPEEKRLLAVIRSVAHPEQELLTHLHALLDGLDALLVSEGLLPGRPMS
jgi:hypothetical protein